MRISTNEFLLGSLNDLLTQEQNVNQLNREISTGESMLTASSDPGGAGVVIGLSNQIGTLSYDTANGNAATQTLQNGVSTLQQVNNLLVQLRQTASAATNATATTSDRQADINSAQSLLQQIIQLGNTQTAGGSFLFSGTKSNAPAFTTLPSGQVVFNGDAGINQIEIAPSLNVPSTISGQQVFMDVPAGADGIAVSASGGNAGTAYAVAQGVTNLSQVTAASIAGTEYDITFSASGSSLSYHVTSGHGTPGSAGYIATSGVVASGAYAVGSSISFGGMTVEVNGTPAAGDSFAVQPGASSSLFQTIQNLITALKMPQSGGSQTALAQQALQNVLANLDSAQTNVLSAQATLGSSLAEIQSVQTQTATESANASTQMSNLQSASMPAVLANYSAGVTALQAAEEAFSKVQNLTLFQYLH
ncbi:MAG TPA: flagellar hook-associated protein FlgL [Stellaceae bacterium]|nr:flagellar hook-associated protein FlgL [Stellaceae bacterium]